MTGVTDVHNEIEGFALGAVDYVHKPFDKELLLRRIETHLSLSDSRVELLNTIAEAQKTAQVKSNFLSTMCHEVRNPLNTILGMINIAKSTDDLVKIQSCLDKAENASHRLLGIIDDILDMAKIETNKLELVSNTFNLKKMLLNIANVVNVQSEEKQQNLVINLNSDVPLFIVNDELRLSQVIVNLLTNAVKFTPFHGTVTVSIDRIEESDKDATLKIEIMDTGVGISEDQQKRLFTSYGQADDTIGVTGLGLAISKRIVELMGGAIWVESEIGSGSRFIFTIKTKKSAGPAVETVGFAYGQALFNDHTILVAEDIKVNREILAALLEPTCLQIDYAENGREAVRMFTKSPDKYGMIFMALRMPEMDGYEATRNIRAIDLPRAKTIPIIAMTANALDVEKRKCTDVGMNAHVRKPLIVPELIGILNKYLIV